ncbi:MAG TPA: uroporphyrinogen decarboxylase family protein [bacterium]|nr:uroporphyrinogen decarboxylase family protein [bacterium]HPO52580.1 uroporphyrinogen decarboxylase family protein [bacterium]
MSGRELVIKAVLFQKPERIPYTLPEEYGSDMTGDGVLPDPSWKPSFPPSETKWEDEWHCVWERLSGDITKGQVTVHPLKDYQVFDSFQWPDFKIPERYKAIKECGINNKEDKFVLASIDFSLMHRLEYLRGHENAWTDPYLEPDNLNKLLDKLAELAIDQVDRVAEAGAHGIVSADDLGFQDRPMVSPEIFHNFFAPYYKKVYQHARKKGILCLLHSCGYIIDLLDDLIDAGLQVIQMDQQENMGLENLDRKFGGRICFWCPVDIQKTMNSGTVEDVKNYARKLIDTFGKYDGGFIAKWYPSPDAVGHTKEKIKAMCETFISYGSQFYKNKKG